MSFLRVTEIFHSIQGESTWAGLPCTFVRLTGCPLRCVWCDSAYAFHGGERMRLDRILDEVREMSAVEWEGGELQADATDRMGETERAGPETGGGHEGGPLVEITGGEPLVHPGAFTLAERLLEEGYTVLVETSGAVDVSPMDPRVHKIMDLKCPGSGETAKNLWSNLEHLTARDEVKFVVADRDDWDWAADVIRERDLDHRVRAGELKALLVSPVWEGPELANLARWVLESGLHVRMQVQLHKQIWGDVPGV